MPPLETEALENKKVPPRSGSGWTREAGEVSPEARLRNDEARARLTRMRARQVAMNRLGGNRLLKAAQSSGSVESPKPTMPKTRMMMMVGVASSFYVFQFIFSLFFIFAPMIAGSIAGGAAFSICDKYNVFNIPAICGGIATAVGTAAAAATVAADVLSGGAITATGAVIASLIGFVAFLTFFLWFAWSGVEFFGTKRATKRFYIRMAGFLASVIPIVDIAPWIVINVWVTCKEARKEDAERLAAAQAKMASATQAGNSNLRAAIGAERTRAAEVARAEAEVAQLQAAA